MGRNVCHRAEPASRWTTRWRAHRVCAGAARSPDRLAAHDSSLDSDGHLLLARMDGEPRDDPVRSEEHTSELQSRPHLVCRLLLEKKKKKTAIVPNWQKNKDSNL